MLSMDLKVMLRSNKGCKFILCIIDEATNYFNYGTDTSVNQCKAYHDL